MIREETTSQKAMSRKKKKEEKSKKYARYILILGVSVFVLALIAFALYSQAYAAKVYRNQYLGGVKLDGLSEQQLRDRITRSSDQYLNSEIKLHFSDQDKNYSIAPAEIGLNYDTDKTVSQIWATGHKEGAFKNIVSQAKSLFQKTDHSAIYTLNEDSVVQKISDIANQVDSPEKDCSINFAQNKFELSLERKPGRRIDQDHIISNIKNQLSSFQSDTVVFSLKEYQPKIKEEKAQAALAVANKVLEGKGIVLLYNDQKFKAGTDKIGTFISSKSDKDDLLIVPNDTTIKDYLATLKKAIDIEPVNAKLSIANSVVTVLSPSRPGKVLDENKAFLDIKTLLLGRINGAASAPDILLSVVDKDPEVKDSEVANLGIRDLVGTAMTDYKGSPTNRTHNIAVGAASLSGIIVKPGETFSTLAHLGNIDEAAGYLPELVIKDNSTVPEFGGGLCQVSSTLFRSAMSAGLKIVERQNHKYRVSYYEPPVGEDATIYDPAPDFKFTNTYSSYILIQSHIEGTKITFDIYGTKDGRIVTISDPTLTNVVPPAPPLYTETDTMPAGQTKRVESGHAGATTNFNYKVTLSNGEIMQDRNFKSVYIPWQEKWLVGKGTNVPPTCSNGAQDGDETGIDIGGSCPKIK